MAYKHNLWIIWLWNFLGQPVTVLGFDKYIFLWSLFNLQVFAVISYISEDLRGLAKYCMNMTSIFWRIILQLSRSGSSLTCFMVHGVLDFSTNQTASKQVIDWIQQKYSNHFFLYEYYLLEILPNIISQFAYFVRESNIFSSSK